MNAGMTSPRDPVEGPAYFYVGWVKGTGVFKVGVSKDPATRADTMMSDLKGPSGLVVLQAVGLDHSTRTEIKKRYEYVVLEECQTRKEAFAIEQAFRDGLPFKRLTRGDWFILERCART